jgi:hypothetical protein
MALVFVQCPLDRGGRLPSSQFELDIWRLAGDTLNITCNFRYCNRQVHRLFDHSVFLSVVCLAILCFSTQPDKQHDFCKKVDIHFVLRSVHRFL